MSEAAVDLTAAVWDHLTRSQEADCDSYEVRADSFSDDASKVINIYLILDT
jgi:3-dehydroquinate dehydratase